MTKRQRKWLQAYVDQLRPMLGLSDWEVVVQTEPSEDGTIAQCYPIYGCRFAKVRVSGDFFSAEARYQRVAILHELLHCVFAHVQHQVEYTLPNHWDKDVAKLFCETYYHAEEYAIDGLATAMAPRFPLPEAA